MGGISAGQAASIAKSVCLSLIGGIPLMGTMKSFTEGAPVAKQLGGAASFSMPSLSMLKDSLSGMNPEAMLGKVFENPMGNLTSAIGDKLANLPSTLESTFVEMIPNGIPDPVTGLEGTMRAIKSGFGNLSLESLDGLKTSLSGMAPSLDNFKDITDKISGVKLPTYGNFDNIDMKDFGMPQVSAVMGSFTQLTSKIPTDLDGLAGGVKNLVETNLDTIIKPINSGTQLADINNSLTGLVSNLQSAASGSGNLSVSSIISSATDGKAYLDSTYANSRETMSRFVEGGKTMGYVDVVSSTMDPDGGATAKTKGYVTAITKPTVMTQIQEGITRYKQEYNQNT